MQDPLEVQFENLGQLVDRWQQTNNDYNRAVSIFAFIAGTVFALLMIGATR